MNGIGRKVASEVADFGRKTVPWLSRLNTEQFQCLGKYTVHNHGGKIRENKEKRNVRVIYSTCALFFLVLYLNFMP